MVKIICPEYDKNNKNWVEVNKLTQDLARVKTETGKYEKLKIKKCQ